MLPLLISEIICFRNDSNISLTLIILLESLRISFKKCINSSKENCVVSFSFWQYKVNLYSFKYFSQFSISFVVIVLINIFKRSFCCTMSFSITRIRRFSLSIFSMYLLISLDTFSAIQAFSLSIIDNNLSPFLRLIVLNNCIDSALISLSIFFLFSF